MALSYRSPPAAAAVTSDILLSMNALLTLAWFDDAADLMQRGGPVMWPILALSALAVTLILERSAFFWRCNRPSQQSRVATLNKRLRTGDRAGALRLAEADHSLFGEAARRLLDEPATEAAATEILETQRHRLERFLPTLSTIITAAPMLGILGTVLGIISSFEVLGDAAASRDPALVGQGIAAALLTTAAGLVVALVTLLPYNLLRTQADRTLSQLEALMAAGLVAEQRRLINAQPPEAIAGGQGPPEPNPR